MFKVGIVGTGIIGAEHVKAIQRIEEFELACLCDVNENAVKPLSESLGVPYFLDYKKIPESIKLDAVILNLPHFLHCEATVFFLDAGVNVLIEKPMANTVAECDEMIAAAKKSGKKLAVAHIQRYYQANAKIRELVEEGKLGRFCMSTEQRSINYFLDSRPRWFLDKEKAGGGITMNYGAHALDKLFYITGEKTVDAISVYGNYKNDFNVEGHTQFIAKFESGASASVTFSAYNTVIYDDVYYFTNGAVRCLSNSIIDVTYGNGFERFEIKADGHEIERELRDFLCYIKGEPSGIPDGEYGKAVIKTIEKVFTNQF